MLLCLLFSGQRSNNKALRVANESYLCMQQVYLGLHASSVRSVHNLCCGSPRYGCGCDCGLWRVGVNGDANRAATTRARARVRARATARVTPANTQLWLCTAENKLNNYDKNGSKLCVLCAVAASKGSTTFAPALAPSSSLEQAMRNAQRATCSWQWPPLWHKPNKWKLFKVCFGLWPPWRTG